MPGMSASSCSGIGSSICFELAGAGASGQKLIPFGPVPLGIVFTTFFAAMSRTAMSSP